MRDRIFGIETEYGCLAPEHEGFVSPDTISVKVKDHIFHVDRIGIVDIHYRGRDEPPGNGGFCLMPGGLYRYGASGIRDAGVYGVVGYCGV